MKGLNIFFAIPPVANLLSVCCLKFTGSSQNIVVSLLILRDKSKIRMSQAPNI